MLREHLNNYYLAYIDNILIYSSSSKKDYKEKVQTIILKLREASLYLDIKKSKFGVTKTKYLGFIIKARKGISIDLEKVEAIIK